jgi:hypothetical protein
MIKKLMESFDIDAAKLAGYSKFDVKTLTVDTKFGDVDKQLNGIEVELERNQFWEADFEEGDGNGVDIIGHRELLAQTLCNRVDDVDDADCSGPSRRRYFSCSTGNSTNNSTATIRQHTMCAKALRNIDLVDKNYTLQNDLAVIQDQMASILAQDQLLQEQLSMTQTQTNCALPASPNEDRMDDDAPVPIRRESINMKEQDGAESLGSAPDHGYLGLVCPVDSSMEEDEPMQIPLKNKFGISIQ